MTLEPQTSELPHETEYLLDQAVEFGDMDGGTRMLLITFGDRKCIEDILEGREPWTLPDTLYNKTETHARFNRFKARRLRLNEQLTAHAEELLAELDPVYRIGAHLTAINGLLASLRSTAHYYSESAMVDSLEVGNLAPFSERKHNWREQTQRDNAPTKRISRRLHAPAFIKRYVEGQEESLHMRKLWHTLKRRGIPEYCAEEAQMAQAIFDVAYERHRARVQTAQDRALASFIASVSLREEVPHYAQKQRRKSAKRAALFATGLLGASVVSAFASGKPVHIEGQSMVFEVKKRASIHRVGHAALDLAVLDKSRVKLAELCFYIEKAPAIDQLSGIALSVQAGEEREVLSTANITRVTPAGVVHELLGERTKPVIWSLTGRADPHTLRQMRNGRYWAETQSVWIDTLGVYVFNRDWKRFKGMMEV